MKKLTFVPVISAFLLLSSCGLVSNTPDNELNPQWRWPDGKPAIVDKNGTVITSTLQYAEVCSEYSEWKCYVKQKNGKYGYLDTNGEEIIPFIYDSAASFSDGLASVSKDGKRYFIDKSGDIVIDFTWKDYEGDLYFFNGVLPVRKITASKSDDKFGVINKKWELIVPIEYYLQGTQYSSGGTTVKNNFAQWKIVIFTWSVSNRNVKRGYLFPDGTVEWNK